MKTIRYAALALLCTIGAVAQVPDAISVQGILTDDTDTPIAGSRDITLELWTSPAGGAKVWERTYDDTAIDNGLIQKTLQGGSPPLRDVSFNNPLYLQVKVAIPPGIDEEVLSPRTPILGTPYALTLRGLQVDASQVVGEEGAINLVGGYFGNRIDNDAIGATISGGGSAHSDEQNVVTGYYGTVAGGFGNEAASAASVSGGYFNDATGSCSTIGGGSANTANGACATVPGGSENQASGDYSFAAGRSALAQHDGSFVWRDDLGETPYASTGSNQFLIRAAGGVGIGTNNPQANLHVLDPNDTSLIFIGGEGTGGPNGIIFDDETEGEGVQLLWRTTPNQLLLERSSTGAAHPSAFLYDKDDDYFDFNGANQQADAGALATKHVVSLRNTNMNNTSDVLALTISSGTSATLDNNFITFFNRTDPIGSIQSNTGGTGITYETSSADYAEYLVQEDVSEVLEPGDIVGVRAGKVSKITRDADRIMVVSESPAVLGNHPGEDGLGGYVPIAFLGQVEVSVEGSVAAGDYIVASGKNDGAGVAVGPDEMTIGLAAQIVGRAWDNSPGAGSTHALIQVGLDRADVLTDLLRRREDTLQNLIRRVEKLEQDQLAVVGCSP